MRQRSGLIAYRSRLRRATGITLFVVTVLSGGVVFVDFSPVRVKAVQHSIRSEQGVLQLELSDSPELRHLPNPFALIARISTQADATFAFVINDSERCERRVRPNESGRVDCAIVHPIAAGPVHALRIIGPTAPWTLDYLELTTHHGNTTRLMESFVLPAASTSNTKPTVAFVALVSIIVFALELLCTPERPTFYLLVAYRAVVGLMALILSAALVSPYVSAYRLVISLRTFVWWLGLFLVRPLWSIAKAGVETRRQKLSQDRTPLAGRFGFTTVFVAVAWCAFRDLSYARDLVAGARMGNLVGWDLLPTCHGLASFAAGSNPYVVGNLNNAPGPAAWMTFPYPIAAAYPAKILCLAQGGIPNAHVGIYLAVLAGSCAALTYSLWRSAGEAALVMLTAVSAFGAYRWLALTGNIAIFEVPFAALSVAMLRRRRYAVSGAALGLMSTLKVLPLVGALAFLILPIDWPKRLRAVTAAGLAFGAFHLLNAVISGPYAWSFYAASFGQIPGQAGLAGEPGGLNNPNSIDFAFVMFAKLGLGAMGPAVSAIAFCAMAAGAALVVLAYRTAGMDDDATVRLFGLAVLVGTLFLFRLKPYAYGALVPFAIAAVALPNRAMRCLGYLVLATVPALFLGGTIDPASTYAYFQIVSLLAFLTAAAGLNAYWLVQSTRSAARV